MIGLESFTEDPDQVNYLIRWWVAQSGYRYHRVRRRGTVKDFINDVWCRLLSTFMNGKQVNYTLATVIINTCYWELGRPIRGKGERTTQNLSYKLRMARPVKPDDRVGDADEADRHIHGIEFDDSIAEILRSLTFREAVIVRARYGLLGDSELTLEEVGAALKVTRERVRQIETKALDKIRNSTRIDKLIPFWNATKTTGIDEAKAKKMQRTEYGAALFEELTKD